MFAARKKERPKGRGLEKVKKSAGQESLNFQKLKGELGIGMTGKLYCKGRYYKILDIS